MALSIRKQLLDGYLLHELLDVGFVNFDFYRHHCLKFDDNPYYMVQLIDQYIYQVEMILSDLDGVIDPPDVDYTALATMASRLKQESSSYFEAATYEFFLNAFLNRLCLCIGAEEMKIVSDLLIQACKARHCESVSQAVSYVENAFSAITKKFETFLEMELEIVNHETDKKNGD